MGFRVQIPKWILSCYKSLRMHKNMPKIKATPEIPTLSHNFYLAICAPVEVATFNALVSLIGSIVGPWITRIPPNNIPFHTQFFYFVPFNKRKVEIYLRLRCRIKRMKSRHLSIEDGSSIIEEVNGVLDTFGIRISSQRGIFCSTQYLSPCICWFCQYLILFVYLFVLLNSYILVGLSACSAFEQNEQIRGERYRAKRTCIYGRSVARYHSGPLGHSTARYHSGPWA